MGTRADFYIGIGKDAEWLGSVAWDGYQWDEDSDCALSKANTVDDFKSAVTEILKDREDATMPSDGWPWPWDNSNTTDYAYCFQDGKTVPYCFGSNKIVNEEGESDWDDANQDFPNMKDKANVAFGSKSGLIILGA